MKKILLILFFLVSLSQSVLAATYYVDDSASDDTGDGSTGSPKKYIKSGIGLMSANDTLTIRDGTYTGDDNCLYFYTGIPNGTSGNYTTIKAENDFGVIIDGENTRPTWYVGNSSGLSYIRFEGMIFRNSTKNAFMISDPNSHHVKVLRCAAYNAGPGDSFNFASVGTYHLFEDCFAWGRGRYKFCCGSTYVILRRCVARYDYHDPINGVDGNSTPKACFAFYQHENCYMQNCIAIDSLYTPSSLSDPETRAFQSANGSTAVTIDSSIAINIDGRGILWESTNPDSAIKNTVVIDTDYDGILPVYLAENHPVTIDHVTVMTKNDPYGMSDGITTWSEVTSGGMYVTNSIIQGLGDDGIRNATSSNYNSLYDNADDYDGISAGADDLCADNANAIDALDGTPGNGTSSLKYILKIEDSSDLDRVASDSGDIGATILYRLGAPETVYDEEGWNTLQVGESGKLWPWPNEDTIRSLMKSYSDYSINGDRGFCADGISLDGVSPLTLTRYIWEYLGNEIPGDIYTDETAPTVSSASLATDGETYTINCSENMQAGAGGEGGLVATGSVTGAVNLTVTDITGSIITATGESMIDQGETITIAYTQPTNGLQDTADTPNDMANFSGESVYNGSLQGGAAIRGSMTGGGSGYMTGGGSGSIGAN
jgi:hypothetical protein